MIWFILIELFILVVTILFSKLEKLQLSALLILIMILLPSGLMGMQIGGRIGLFLVPYAVYGYEEVHNNNIVCVELLLQRHINYES